MEQFIVSARKYRPQTFKDVVGQQSITATLNNAIETNHLAQALLFTGPRGVGKTTCARILARKINQPGYDDPNEDFAFNVFELDAASNNSVDDIRSLIDQIRIPPQTGIYKVYIIDEVHMLSASAFNAFLKTLEEPPKHAIFILATTEKHKIIPTILSRCQIFDFRRITIKDAREHLAEVAKSQGVTFEEEALQIIARKADGAMRDALSIFDRVVSYCGTNLTRQAVAENLSVLDYETYLEFTALILSNNIPELLVRFDQVLAKGFDPHHFILGLASHFRDLLVAKDPSTISLLETGEQSQKAYYEQSQQAPREFLLKAIAIANEADLKFKVSQNQRLLIELCLMQLASILFDGEKKVDGFVIPASHFQKRIFEIPVKAAELLETPVQTPSPEPVVVAKPKPVAAVTVSAFSLAGLKAKQEIEQARKNEQSQQQVTLTEPFTETQMLEFWYKYAQRMIDQKKILMSTNMQISEPKLKGTTIVLELPNESVEKEFDAGKADLLGYLRGHLHNHDITIEVIVDEKIVKKKSTAPRDVYDRLMQINPSLEMLRRAFDLEL